MAQHRRTTIRTPSRLKERKAERPVLDVRASFERTMREYPLTMARLAE